MAYMYDMIVPFSDKLDTHGVLSHGLSSYGYDIRVSNNYKIFVSETTAIARAHRSDGAEELTDFITIDPKNINPELFVDETTDVCVIPPNTLVLAESMEYIKMPEDCMAFLKCKSTYIRAGLSIPGTVLEAGWIGTITLELSNLTPLPIKVYSFEGIAQLMFFRGVIPPQVSYAARGGKYQGQKGITLPKV
jgi:dCTP deaminase